MAAKFIELNEAAGMLGVSPDQLNDMRLRGEIHGVRDGSTWKFKSDEVERVIEDRGGPAPDAQASDDSLEFESAGSDQLDYDAAADADSPTAIGSMEDFEDLGMPLGSDLEVGSDKSGDKPPKASSDVALVPDQEGSGVNLVPDSGVDILSGSDLGFGSGGSDLSFEGSDLGFEGSDLSVASDVTLDKDKDKEQAAEPPSEVTVNEDEDLALDDDDELVLEGSGDVTGGTGDTGINLTSPSDSGLNLEEEPLDLAGSSVSSLELPEDEDIIDLDDLEPGPETARRPRRDEDFQLAPSALAGDDDEEDSGSQVIALEDSEAFDAGATALVDEDEAVIGQPDELEGALDQQEATPVMQPMPGAAMYGPAPEMPYSIWNVLSLLLVLMILALTGMLMADLMRNIWSWNENYSASSFVMDTMVGIFGLKP